MGTIVILLIAIMLDMCVLAWQLGTIHRELRKIREML